MSYLDKLPVPAGKPEPMPKVKPKAKKKVRPLDTGK